MYDNRIFRDANFELYGRCIDPGSDFQSEQTRTCAGETHACGDTTDFRGFIATAWPPDIPPLPGD